MTSDDEQKKEEEAAGYIRTDALAAYIGISTRRLQQYRADGALATEKTKWGQRYRFMKAVQSFIRYILSRQESKNVKQRIDSATADLRERQAARELIKLKRLRGEVHDAKHVKAIMTRNNADIRAAFIALPGRIAPELAACAGANELAAVLRREIFETLRMLATREYSDEEFRAMVEADGDQIDTGDDNGNETDEE